MKTTRKVIAAAIASCALAAGSVLALAPAASAASKVSFCFEFANGKTYAHKPAYLMRKIAGHNTRVRRTLTDGDGCGVFLGTRTDRTFWVKAAYVKSSPNSVYWYAGRTPEKAGPGKGAADLGTGTVRLVRAISAAYLPPPR